jgi:protease IV
MGFIKSFWKFIQKIQSFVGTFLFLIILLLFSGIIFESMFIDSSDNEFKVKNSALVLNFKGLIVEQETFSSDPYEQLLAGKIGSNTRLRDVTKALELAAIDDDIKVLVLDFKNFAGAYPSKLHYIGEKITEFKQSGKKVISYGSLYSQSAYLLSSFSDEIYMHPQGSVLLYGYGSYQNYYQGFLEKVKAEVQLFRVGKFKSAMEPFIRSDMSDEARLASLELYGGLWDQYISEISKQRNLEENVIRDGIENADQLIINLGGDFGKLALENSLVDGLKTRAEWVEYLQSLVGKGNGKKEINQINFADYLASKFDMGDLERGKNIVAVVYASGAIMDGNMPQGTVGGDTLSRQLRGARLDKNVKAVVLRVDSPGGSAFASELIRQEVLLLKKAGKPIIASFASVAASGGYWISANADEIWASPTTITGSIGIFGAIPNIEGTLAAIGITTDGVGTTSLSSAPLYKPLPQKLKNIIQSNIENGYQRFLNIVAEGRNMTTSDVNEIAQGRVWTGLKAKEIGLVDHLGNIDQAINSAATMAKLENYKVRHWEDKVPFQMQLIAKFFENQGQMANLARSFSERPEQVLMKKITEKLSIFSIMNDPQHAYVLCVNCVGGLNPQY